MVDERDRAEVGGEHPRVADAVALDGVVGRRGVHVAADRDRPARAPRDVVPADVDVGGGGKGRPDMIQKTCFRERCVF